MFEFTILKKDDQTSARTGQISTAHGNIPTPIFMPVGTLGSVKAIHQHELIDPIAAKIILGNIRSTFGNSIPGGGDNIQLNGESLLEKGYAELEALKKELINSSEPMLMIFG